MEPTLDERHSGNRKWIALLVIALALVWIAIWQRDRIREWWFAPSSAEVPHEGPTRSETLVPEELPVSEAEARWEALLGRAPVWEAPTVRPPGRSGSSPDPSSVEPDCAAADQEWRTTCLALEDQRILPNESGSTACEKIDAVLEMLLKNPPTATGELRDYGRILTNATYLFRMLGRKETEALRQAMQDSTADHEALAMTLSRRVRFLAQCSPELRLPADAVYRYAAFLLQSLGGQAYLRRRSPRVEALATYYALETLDQADEAGQNPEGFDVLPEIERSRQLILGQSFLFESDYINRLDRMQARWERRTP